MFSTAPKPKQGPPRTPRGYRAYAVGDIHGRLDLLDELLAMIEQDVERRPARKTLLIFLGDLIDRGPDSRGVVERLRTYRHDRLEPYFLAGNHEEVLLRLLAGERGILPAGSNLAAPNACRAMASIRRRLAGRAKRPRWRSSRTTIPAEHARFIGGFADTLSFGDYLFVHAGIRPGVDLSLQSQTDLRWIRSPFLEDARRSRPGRRPRPHDQRRRSTSGPTASASTPAPIEPAC